MITQDLIQVLQNNLGDNYLIVPEEKRDYNFDGNVVVVSEYQGENYSNAYVYNYQVTVYTFDVVNTMQELDVVCHQMNDQVFQTKDFAYVKLLVNAPTNVTNFQITKDDYTGVISFNVQAIAAKEADEVKYIILDGMILAATRTFLTFQTEITSLNNQGDKLNDAEVSRATLLIQCTIPATSGIQILKKHIFDSTVSINKVYNLILVYVDGSEQELNVKIKDIANPNERGALPLYTVTFMFDSFPD